MPESNLSGQRGFAELRGGRRIIAAHLSSQLRKTKATKLRGSGLAPMGEALCRNICTYCSESPFRCLMETESS